ncbi:DsbA family protein [Rhodocaloribacter litoris]|uniref:DsbA family protein n=1 Tax=Rhodocaloribacter litoris TaxID=2558931 RepID=UPI00142480C6|nr:thioredoxin domain-containing protein [Rhodocaloribacter litoris]QXD14751.1 DsbA family protein [Rhodocaloribacter litoris]
MKNLITLLSLAAVLIGCNPQVNGQTPDVQGDRKARILANLTHQIPQLKRLDPQMGDLAPSELPGFDEGAFTFMTQRGRQEQRFLVSTDDRYLYLIAAGPFDVSRSAEEIAEAEARARQATHETLLAAAKHYPVRGNPEAPVTIVEFSDFQCPYCARATGTVEEVLAKYPDEVRLVYAHFPLDFHAWARPAAIAATCAAGQSTGAFWTLHDFYFDNQQTITPENVLSRSKEVLSGTGIDLAAWSTCAEDTTSDAHAAAARQVQAEMNLGIELGVTGTPGFFVNGRFLSGVQPLEAFEQAIREARQEAP